MGLITRPVVIESGVWIAARCVVTASMVRKQESPYGAGSIVND
jgi:acetyltransferase-like isoleucine patch superfamily enzyme